MSDPRRSLPGVDRLLETDEAAKLLEAHPRDRVVERLRRSLANARTALAAAPETAAPAPGELIEAAALALEREAAPSLRPVVNATGVLLHTNLGRAPLAPEAVAAMREVASGYSNLEYDLDEGARGSRYEHARHLLTVLTGAEDALVVNNAAGALILALAGLTREEEGGRPGVAVSRGELIEIGGGFRLPEVIRAAGVRLVEVGTTNRTRIGDYREAVEGGGVGALLKVHRSNFRMTGFTEEAELGELASLGADTGLPVIHDLGSGLLVEAGRIGLPSEPRPHDGLEAGADVVLFSGDKLLGGPQAGILVGRAAAIGALRSHPLCRALRVDGATLAALEATLRLYRSPESAVERIPTLAMLTASVEEVEARARRVLEGVGEGAAAPSAAEEGSPRGAGIPPAEVVRIEGRVGGGTLPEHPLPSAGIRMAGSSAEVGRWAAALRAGNPPVVARVEGGTLLLDLRTVLPGEEEVLVAALRRVFGGG